MNEDDKLLQELSNQLQKSNELLERSYKRLTEKDLIIKNQAEQLTIWKRIEKSDSWYDYAEAAKMLNYKKVGRNILLAIMRDHGLFRSNNEPYQEYVDRGYFKVTPVYIEEIDETKLKPLISTSGLDYIRKLLDGEGYEPKTN